MVKNAFYAFNVRKNVPFLAEVERLSPNITDNGNSVPENIKQKYSTHFSPASAVRTKPTGEGKDFGLSLAYDIVTKGHGGTLEVVSKEDEGSEFIICLPFKP